MCLAVPGKLVSILSSDEATADLGGIQKNVNVSLIADPKPGDWVIIHVGFALQRINEEEARATLALLADAANSGDAAQEPSAEAAA
ncbi:MAG: HypC/HybG/HupF family hydrogenase formation chaperone [Mesosutterella sp.]|nr:HypC/HybG/HupF family hydrogenase formation chaperone [Mesosutterella sp.]